MNKKGFCTEKLRRPHSIMATDSLVMYPSHIMCQGHQPPNVMSVTHPSIVRSLNFMKKGLFTCFRAQLIITSKERWKNEENWHLSTVILSEIVFAKTYFRKRSRGIMLKESRTNKVWELTIWIKVCFPAELLRALNMLTRILQYS